MLDFLSDLWGWLGDFVGVGLVVDYGASDVLGAGAEFKDFGEVAFDDLDGGVRMVEWAGVGLVSTISRSTNLSAIASLR